MPPEAKDAQPELSEELKRWLSKGKFRTLCSHSIFTIDEGDKELPVVLLIHGFPTSTWDWAPVWETLRENYRLVCLDMLGFGFSDKPNRRDYTIHQQADLFEALIDELGIERYHVLAHDYGVSVAQELLARQLDGTGSGAWLSCCFLNGGLFPETHRALLIQKLMLSPVGKYVNKFTGYPQFVSAFSKVFGAETKPDETELQQFWSLINYNNGRHLFHNLITYIDDRKRHRERWLKALQTAPVPISLINGSVDPVSGAHLVQRHKELKCRLDHLLELPKIGHYPHVESPNEVAEGYLEFLRSIGSS